MASKSSKAIPFFVLFIVGGIILMEAVSGVKIDLEAYMPVLVALGLGGAAKSTITRVVEARKNVSPDVEAQIKKEVDKIIAQKTNPVL